jgi:hypothetical protein
MKAGRSPLARRKKRGGKLMLDRVTIVYQS